MAKFIITPIQDIDGNITAYNLNIDQKVLVNVAPDVVQLFGNDDKGKVMSFIAQCIEEDINGEQKDSRFNVHYHHFNRQAKELAFAVILDRDNPEIVEVNTLQKAHMWGQNLSQKKTAPETTELITGVGDGKLESEEQLFAEEFIRQPETPEEISEARRLLNALKSARTPEERQKAEIELGEFDRDVLDR